ncbi:cardiolipin synthase [Bacteriovoracaceae bacterium]|nr:cardiolipin synthase [Bacteriovoracaceae bacterium]
MIEFILEHRNFFIGLITLILMFFSFSHAIITKRDPRAALGWAGIILFSPLLGVFLYFTFGINRIRRKARKLSRKIISHKLAKNEFKFSVDKIQDLSIIKQFNFSQFILAENITKRQLFKNCQIYALLSGDETYQEMFKAIDEAKKCIFLETYIFQNDSTGAKFVEKLTNAQERGVEVKIIIDDIGAKYSFPPIYQSLRKAKLTFGKFLPSTMPWLYAYMNLRNHRKILIIDDKVAFMGGMNITEKNTSKIQGEYNSQLKDIHFKIEGPILKDIHHVFHEDWYFCKKKNISQFEYQNEESYQGSNLCRLITDGPDGDFEKMKFIIIGAINSAKNSINIINPYFLPDLSLISAIESALLREIKINILIPEKNNVYLFNWAQMAMLDSLVKLGANIYLTPPPFDHSKLMVVDNRWSLIGSTNFDARSLRFNFEANLEVYSLKLAADLNKLIEQKIINCQQLFVEDFTNQTYFEKLRNNVSKVFSPYL